jgi:uncharacterized repeat protein (TIGR04076 family)
MSSLHPHHSNDVKITVMKKLTDKDLFEKYAVVLDPQCEKFNVGDEFISKGLRKPEGFCDWAWADIQRDIVHLALGGNYSWIQEKGAAIVCCTDGLRPVVFKLKRIEGTGGSLVRSNN